MDWLSFTMIWFDCNASVIVCRGMPGMMVRVQVSSDDVVVVKEVIEKSRGPVFANVGSGKAGWDITVCYMKGWVCI